MAGPGVDTDNDTVIDSLDNCILAPNVVGNGASVHQCDSDNDGYGNACDPDTNNDNIVGIPDFGDFTANFPSSGPAPHTVADLNCDGVVGIPDFGPFTATFTGSGVPGPSGLPCAGNGTGSCPPSSP
jgi:hypothetical protein